MREQVGVAGDQGIGAAGRDDRQNLIVIGIAADMRHLGRGDDLAGEFSSSPRAARARSGLQAQTSTRTASSSLRIALPMTSSTLPAQHRLQQPARPAPEVERGDEDVGIEDDAQSAPWGRVSPTPAPDRHSDPLLGERARSRAALPVGEELVPSSAPLHILAEGLPEELRSGCDPPGEPGGRPHRPARAAARSSGSRWYAWEESTTK